MIVFAPLRDPSRSRYLQGLSAQGFPVLYIASGEQGPTISVDNASGIHQAVTHLAEHGHRRIAFVAGDPNDGGDSAARFYAYHSAMAQNGLEIVPELIVPGWHTFSGGYAAAQSMLHSGVDFTALVSSDDNCAIGTMQALRESGLQIPRDVAVIGFDDQPDAMAQVPPLASVHIPLLCLVNPMDASQMSFLWRARELQTHKALPATPIRELMLLRQSCKDSLLKWFPLSRLLRSFTSASVQHASAPASCRLFTPV